MCYLTIILPFVFKIHDIGCLIDDRVGEGLFSDVAFDFVCELCDLSSVCQKTGPGHLGKRAGRYPLINQNKNNKKLRIGPPAMPPLSLVSFVSKQQKVVHLICHLPEIYTKIFHFFFI